MGDNGIGLENLATKFLLDPAQELAKIPYVRPQVLPEPAILKEHPHVVLRETDARKTLNTIVNRIYSVEKDDKTPIGHFETSTMYNEVLRGSLSDIQAPPRRAKIVDINLSANRGEGYGKATYLELIQQLGDIPLVSGNTITDDALKVWVSLVRDNVAHPIIDTKDGHVRGFISIPPSWRGKSFEEFDAYARTLG